MTRLVTGFLDGHGLLGWSRASWTTQARRRLTGAAAAPNSAQEAAPTALKRQPQQRSRGSLEAASSDAPQSHATKSPSRDQLVMNRSVWAATWQPSAVSGRSSGSLAAGGDSRLWAAI